MTAIEFLEEINPPFKNQDITKINTFGGEFLIYCVQKALDVSLQFNVKGEDLKIVIDTLKKFNQYRRDKNVPSKVKMVSPHRS